MVAVAASLVLGGAAPAWAQAVGEAPATSATGWGFILLALLLVGCVCVPSFMGSKRGHQD